VNKDILGRGLKSLIPDEIQDGLKTKENVIYLKVDEIEIDDHQPRKTINNSGITELAQSIKEHGIIQPLVVLHKKEGGYQLIAGQRRLRASQEIGLLEVPVIIKKVEPSQKLQMSLIENIQREDLNPLEEAEAYNVLNKDFGLSNIEIAKKVGKAESTVKNSIRLLNLPSEVKEALMNNLLTYGHARAMLTMPKEDQINFLPEIINRKLTVRDVENRCKNYHEDKKPIAEKKIDDFDLYLEKTSSDLRELFQTKVALQRKGKGGRLSVDFYSKEEFERILEIIKKIKDYI